MGCISSSLSVTNSIYLNNNNIALHAQGSGFSTRKNTTISRMAKVRYETDYSVVHECHSYEGVVIARPSYSSRK